MKNIAGLARLRTVKLSPYNNPERPRFVLTTWDTGRTDARGQTVIAYRLKISGHSKALFEGDGFAGSPLHADDSDAACRSILGFLTLRPGDTDAEYFADYTPEQLDFVSEHAEALAMECERRFPVTISKRHARRIESIVRAVLA